MSEQALERPRDDASGVAAVPARRLEWRSLFDGGLVSLAFYLLAGVFILGCLFATVFDGSSKRLSTHYGGTRDRDYTMAWITGGYFKYGGLLRNPGVDWHPAPFFIRNDVGGWLQGVHVLQRLQYWVTGRYNFTLTAIQNQLVTMLSSALLGLLALRVARRVGARPFHAGCLGLACMLVYQTFPKNLMHYWQGSPHAVFVLFLAAFLLTEEIGFEQEALSRAGRLVRALALFGMIYSEHVGGVLFVAVYVVALMIFRRLPRPSSRQALEFFVPVALALGLLEIQVLWVRYSFPSVDMLGSSFGFRSGLDGATTYYKDHLDLLYARRLSFAYPAFGNPNFNDWKWFFITGVVAALILAWNFLRTPALRCPIWILSVALGPYLLQAFIFSQSVVIHSELYDILLALPLTLAVFGVLPSWGEMRTAHTGLPVFLAVLTAFCYAMVQLRTYAAMIPPQ